MAQAEAAAKGKPHVVRYDYYTASYKHGGMTGVIEAIEFRAPHTFMTRGDARAWLDQEEALISSDNWTSPAERVEAEREAAEAKRQAQTIATFGAVYVEGRPSESTRSRYRQLFRFYILGEPVPSRKKKGKAKAYTDKPLGDVLVEKLTRRRVKEWWLSLPLDERADSCHQAFALLRAIMNAAVEDDGIAVEVNPVKLRGAGKASKERDTEPLSLPVLYSVADEMPERYRLGVLLAGLLGLRSGEVRALQRQDIEDDVLHVQHSVDEHRWGNPIGDLKTERSDRRLVIPSVLLPDVKAHLREHTQLGATGLLFWSPSGKPVRSAAWLKMFKKACQKVAGSTDDEHVKHLLADNGGYLFHGTRSTGLTSVYRHSGGNLKAVMAVGGHTSSKTALRYQRAELEYQRVIMEAQAEEIREQGLGHTEAGR
ncbi:MAG: tyrosine-type recombinase/integrase [Propionibacteriaceae bacterium]|nr:tyrosine-type recombinase/integrase [Propionibacteriaceae bacterium]